MYSILIENTVCLGVIQKITYRSTSIEKTLYKYVVVRIRDAHIFFIVIISEKSGSMTIYRGHARAIIARLEFICDSDKVDLY